MSRFTVKRSYRQLQVEKIAMELLIATVEIEIERCTNICEKERVEKLKSRQQSNNVLLAEIERDIEIAKEKMGK